jgi:hypothetical protein
MSEDTNKQFWVKWRKHAAREIILQDLNHGGWLYDELEEKGELDLALVFALYNHRQPEIFNEIDFSQFATRVKDYITKDKDRRDRSKIEYAWMVHDQELYPRKLRNDRGELVFDLHEAKQLLREDVKAKKHAHMVPSDFQTTRPEYEEFERDIFRQRIYQEERYQKYSNWLESKRTKKQEEHKEKQKKKKEKEEEKQKKKKEKEAQKKRKDAEKERKKREAETKPNKAAKKRRTKK